MSALLELAAQCESATGPDRELDADICVVLGVEPQAREMLQFSAYDRCVRYYTASLDAAMTLVPEGFDWIIGRTNDGLTIHACCGDRDMRFGNTPALALCAAALRARATGEQP